MRWSCRINIQQKVLEKITLWTIVPRVNAQLRSTLYSQCITTRSPLDPLPPSPSSSFSINTQNPANTKTTVLAYTGRDLSIIKSIPPSMGAIIPPLLMFYKRKDEEKREGKTHILERAEAIPHAVPRTDEKKIERILCQSKSKSPPFVPKISGVQPYNTDHIV